MDWVNNCCFVVEAPRLVIAFSQRVTTFVSSLWDDQKEKEKENEEVLNVRNQANVNVSDIENPRSLLQNEAGSDIVINVTQTDAGVSAATSLLQQASLSAQETGGFGIENPLSLSPTEVVINVNGAVTDQTDVGASHSSTVGAQATNAFNIESARNLSQFEVMSNSNAEARDQTVVNMSDTASLLPQASIAAQANSTSHIQDPRNLPQEGGQNSFGVFANVGSGVPSQHSGQTPRPIAVHGIDIQALITEAKEVANRVTIMSAGGIFSELSGVIGNEDAVLMHIYFFKAFMILCYVSLASGLALHQLIKISPKARGFVMIVKCTIYFSQGSLVYALSCAICLLFPSKVGVVVILIVPLVPISFVAILEATKDLFLNQFRFLVRFVIQFLSPRL